MKLVLRNPAGFPVFLLLILISLAASCKSRSSEQGAVASTGQGAVASTGQGAVATTGQGASQNPQAQQLSVDDLVAPIALYPDQLLAQVLAISINPQEVLDLGNWLLQNQNLQGDAATNAAKQAGFSASAQYLAMFPQVVDNMCQQMDWTRELGEAFKSDQQGVMAAVQRKRTEAQQMGNLKSTPQMAVENKKADNGQSYVAIQPADPKVVYVPQYNPVTIYNTPPSAAPAQTTTTTESSGVSTGAAVAVGLLSFGVGMAVGSAIHNDDYYPYPAWGYNSVYVANRAYYPPPYRPPVYAGYRPVYGYNPPPNYRWNEYNRNVNVNVNNNYYNRFNNANVNTARNVNARPSYQNPNVAANRPVQNQPNWKGQSTYQGAERTTTPGEKPGASMANAIPHNEQYGQRAKNQVATNRTNAGGLNAANRPNSAASNVAANRATTGNIGRPSATTSAARPAAQPNLNRGGDRGYSAPSAATRAANSPPAMARPAPSSSSPAHSGNAGGAFSGAGSSGRQERAASNRGRASMGGGGVAARRGH